MGQPRSQVTYDTGWRTASQNSSVKRVKILGGAGNDAVSGQSVCFTPTAVAWVSFPHLLLHVG